MEIIVVVQMCKFVCALWNRYELNQNIQMLFSSPDNNITYLLYTRGRDLMVIQHQHQTRNDKLILYAVVSGEQYNVAPCGYKCHLWIKKKVT